MISKTLQEDFSKIQSHGNIFQIFQNKRIYITGANGQIAWYFIHLLCYLIRNDIIQCELTAHARNSQKFNSKFSSYAFDICKFVIGDDAALPLQTSEYDFVFHCAALASPKYFLTTPVDVMYPAGVLTQRLLECIQRNGSDTHFIYLSTTGVTGFVPDIERPSSEAEYGPLSCTDLVNCYLESKRFGEMLSLAFHKQYSIPVHIIRPSITYGPGFDLDDGRSYADFIRALVQKQPISLSSDGSAIRNFLYISDFITGMMTAISKSAAGSVFNISSPNPISILALATVLNDSVFSESLGPVVRGATIEHASGRVNFKSTDASVEKLIQLGWQPHVNLVDGFRKTVTHYQEQSI